MNAWRKGQFPKREPIPPRYRTVADWRKELDLSNAPEDLAKRIEWLPDHFWTDAISGPTFSAIRDARAAGIFHDSEVCNVLWSQPPAVDLHVYLYNGTQIFGKDALHWHRRNRRRGELVFRSHIEVLLSGWWGRKKANFVSWVLARTSGSWYWSCAPGVGEKCRHHL